MSSISACHIVVTDQNVCCSELNDRGNTFVTDNNLLMHYATYHRRIEVVIPKPASAEAESQN